MLRGSSRAPANKMLRSRDHLAPLPTKTNSTIPIAMSRQRDETIDLTEIVIEVGLSWSKGEPIRLTSAFIPNSISR